MQTPISTTTKSAFTALLAALLVACGTGGPSNGNSSKNDSASDDFRVEETISVKIEDYSSQGFQENDDYGTNRISVTALDENFSEAGSSEIPVYRVLKTSDGYEVEFGEPLVEQVDYVLKLRTDDNESIYSPVYSTVNDDLPITINLLSHYVLKKFFDTITTEDQLEEMLPCTNNDPDCPNQPTVKAALLANLTKAIREQEVKVNANLNVDDAISEVENNTVIRSQVETGVNEITRTLSPVTHGIHRAFSITDGDIISSLTNDQEFNGLWFALSINELLPDSGANNVLLAVETSEIIDETVNNTAFPIYPKFINTTTMFEIRRDILIADFPFTRDSLTIDENNFFDLGATEPFNTHSPVSSDSFLSTQSFFLNERLLEQTIPGNDADPKDIGWELNPIYSKVYKVNEYLPETDTDEPNTVEETEFGSSPTWLVSSNYGTGNSFQLTYDSDDNPIRGDIQETANIFSWEIHGLETIDFEESDMTGKEYGAIEYLVDLDETGDVITVTASLYDWDKSITDIVQTQPNSHYETYQLTRDDTNAAPGLATSTNTGITRSLFPIETEESTQENPSGDPDLFKHQGIVGMDSEANGPKGHVSQNGSHLAFTVNDSLEGRGLLLATELRPISANPIFPSSGDEADVYQLSGNVFTLTDTANTLGNINGSSLEILNNTVDVNIDCDATLTLVTNSVSHVLNDNSISEPFQAVESMHTSSACRIGSTGGSNLNSGELELTFDNVNGSTLRLKGFITAHGEGNDTTPGNLINLLWVQSESLGLVFATKEQALSPSFPD